MDDANTGERIQCQTGELAVDQAVVSLSAIAELSGKLDGVRRLTVRRKAVVTPAVRDLLRQRKIELAYRSMPKQNQRMQIRQMHALRLIVGVAETNNMQMDLLLKLLARASVAIQRLAPAGLLAIDRRIGKATCRAGDDRLAADLRAGGGRLFVEPLAGVRAMAAGDAGTLTALGATARRSARTC